MLLFGSLVGLCEIENGLLLLSQTSHEWLWVQLSHYLSHCSCDSRLVLCPNLHAITQLQKNAIDPQDDRFHPFTPDEWSQQTSTMLRTYLIQNLPDLHGPEPVPSGPISLSRPTGYSPAAIELMGFKKGTKR